MQCAKRIGSKAPKSLPVATMQLPPLREAPLQVLERPALLLLRRGDVVIHDRTGSSQPLPRASLGFYPAQADYEGSTWSSGRDSFYSVLELPEATCLDLLGRVPAWQDTLRRPHRFVDPKIAWWMDEIETHCANGEPHGTLYTETVGLALLTYLESSLAGGPISEHDRADSLPQQSMRRMQDYIDEHIAACLSIRDLASACGYSPTHFSRVFRQAFGMPVHQFVLLRRVDAARRMLSDDKASLADIAAECGFSSQAHFSAAFKRHEGITPGSYRNRRHR
jgi:AraC family transcriptional regulator